MKELNRKRARIRILSPNSTHFRCHVSFFRFPMTNPEPGQKPGPARHGEKSPSGCLVNLLLGSRGPGSGGSKGAPSSSPRSRQLFAASLPPPHRLLAASSSSARRLLAASLPPPFHLPSACSSSACSQSVSSPSVSSPSASSPSASTRCRGLLAARPPPRCLSPRRPPASSPPTRLPHCPPASSPSASTFSRHADTPADTPRLLLASSRHILASSPHRLILTVLPHRHASMCLRSTSSHA